MLLRLSSVLSILALSAACGAAQAPPPVDYSRVPLKRMGAVTIYRDIPASCNTVRGIKAPAIRRVRSEKELREHYGLTFLVRFNDGVSPTLYGSMYHQDRRANRYCMALINGAFATFSDRKMGVKRNLIQEVCYPIQPCVKAD